MERLQNIYEHLEGRIQLLREEVGHQSQQPFNVTDLSLFLNGKDTSHRKKAFDFMKKDLLFKLDYNVTKESLRAITRARAVKLVESGFVKVDIKPEDFEKYNQYSEALSYHDSSFNTLFGAHFVLFTGSIFKLGTEYHHTHFLEKAEKAQIRGCFALTELGHGSNVRGIETTATYDKVRQEFVINTPTETAQKYWIGGGYEWAQFATVFAQLSVEGVDYGVHAFIVPLRDLNTNKILAGVRIKDCGHKMGLNGVDNGRFWFDHVRIPREYLLNRYGSVSPQGEYESIVSDNDARFAVTMGNLLAGRVGISKGSTNASKLALATAIRYSFTRKQFGPKANETPIIDYPSQQMRLFPLLATTYANHFISKKVGLAFFKAQQEMDIDAIKEIHIILSGLKSICSWHVTETLQACREACGGQGYKSANRIGILKADTDVQSTYEGDNLVLLQQVSKDLSKSETKEPLHLKNDLEIKERLDENYLSSIEFQLKSFELRTKDLIYQFNMQFTEAKKKGMTSEKALQQCSLFAVDAGRAFIELKIFEEFIEQEKQAPFSIKHQLSLLRSLYALTRFEAAPSFLRGQYFTQKKQHAIRDLFLKTCHLVKEFAIGMVDAFDIPDFLLGTIAGDWVAANSYHAEDPA